VTVWSTERNTQDTIKFLYESRTLSMSLSKTFQFSATSLQDYVDCARRFQLRYLLQIAWPAPVAEPIAERERRDQAGRDFHQLVHRHLLGIPAETLSATVQDDPDLRRWWQAYLAYWPTLQAAQVIPEVGLSTPLAGYRVIAQYDALVLRDERPGVQGDTSSASANDGRAFLIVDWKTFRQRPSRAWLAGRLQTHVYPLVWVQAGAALVRSARKEEVDQPIQPDQVEMRYWLAEYPHLPETFVYDAPSYQADLDYLTALITEIAERAEAGPAAASVFENVWPLTDDWGQCRFCSYRSFCERGDKAGPVAEYLESQPEGLSSDVGDLSFDLDWGQVQEIVY
jgi:hypothetical protein